MAKWYVLVRYNYGPDGKLWDSPGPISIHWIKKNIESMVHKEKPCDRGWSEWRMVEVESPI